MHRKEIGVHTAMDDAMYIVEVRQTLQHGQCNVPNDFDINGPDFLVDAVERPLVHVFHAYADIWVGQERAIKGDDIRGVTVVHDVQLAQDLFAHGWFGVNEDDLRQDVSNSHAREASESSPSSP